MVAAGDLVAVVSSLEFQRQVSRTGIKTSLTGRDVSLNGLSGSFFFGIISRHDGEVWKSSSIDINMLNSMKTS